jgi:hypothetical protein
VTPPDPSSLYAGAFLPHGEHERPDQGWDPWQRIRHGDADDALTYGRHVRTESRPTQGGARC